MSEASRLLECPVCRQMVSPSRLAHYQMVDGRRILVGHVITVAIHFTRAFKDDLRHVRRGPAVSRDLGAVVRDAHLCPGADDLPVAFQMNEDLAPRLVDRVEIPPIGVPNTGRARR